MWALGGSAGALLLNRLILRHIQFPCFGVSTCFALYALRIALSTGGALPAEVKGNPIDIRQGQNRLPCRGSSSGRWVVQGGLRGLVLPGRGGTAAELTLWMRWPLYGTVLESWSIGFSNS